MQSKGKVRRERGRWDCRGCVGGGYKGNRLQGEIIECTGGQRWEGGKGR